jgi:formiminotetrahydrofolate cyclodeaminase
MTFEKDLQNAKKIYDELLKLQKLKKSYEELQEVAEHIIEKELPFSFTMHITLKVPNENPENANNAEETLKNLLNTDNPGEFYDILNNAEKRMDTPKNKDKTISINLNELDNNTFAAVLEKLVTDLKQKLEK